MEDGGGGRWRQGVKELEDIPHTVAGAPMEGQGCWALAVLLLSVG